LNNEDLESVGLTLKKLENLVNHNHSLLTYLGSNGNFCPSLGFLNRWTNRFNLQILRFNEKDGLDDLYRICSELVFLKLTQEDQIRKKSISSDDNLIGINTTDLGSYFPQRIHYPLDEQSLVKMIALLHILAKEIDEREKITSSFKVQQFLTLSNKFANSGHFFLAFQVPYFLMNHQKYDIKYPLDWSNSKIRDYGRRLLLEESNVFFRLYHRLNNRFPTSFLMNTYANEQ